MIRIGVLAAATSRSTVAASLAWFLLLGAVYASDAGPPLPAMAFTAAALFPIAAWAALSQLAATSSDLRSLQTAASGPGRVLVADAAPGLLWAGAAAVVGVLACVGLDPQRPSGWTAALGLGLHALTAAAGVASALALSSYGLNRGSSTLLVVTGTVACIVFPVAPPVGPVLSAWADAEHPPSPAGAAYPWVSGLVLVGVLVSLAVSARRRRL